MRVGTVLDQNYFKFRHLKIFTRFFKLEFFFLRAKGLINRQSQIDLTPIYHLVLAKCGRFGLSSIKYGAIINRGISDATKYY